MKSRIHPDSISCNYFQIIECRETHRVLIFQKGFIIHLKRVFIINKRYLLLQLQTQSNIPNRCYEYRRHL